MQCAVCSVLCCSHPPTNPPTTNRPSSNNTNAEISLLRQILQCIIPAVVRRFDAVGFPIELITTEWIKTIMMDDFPKSTVFHVWDVMFSGELLPGEGYFLHG